MALGFKLGKKNGAKFNGVLLPSNKVRFSPMFTGSGVSISCEKNSLTKTGNSAWGNIGTIDAYDFTDYTLLTITFTITNYSGDDLVAGYAPSRYNGWDLYNHMTHVDRRNNGTYTVTLNITNVSGLMYVVIGAGKMNYRVDSVILS